MTRLAVALLLVAAAALLHGCAAPPPPPAPRERIVLLPGDDGRPGAVVVTPRAGGSLELNQPYAAAQLSGAAAPSAAVLDAAAVQNRYGTLLSVQPVGMRSYTLYFEFNGVELTSASRRELDRVIADAASLPAPEIDVVGHTDSKGTVAYNDNLGRARAQAIANLVAERGFDRRRISVQSRGERELLVQTPDETDEPRNRRVELRLR